MKLHTKLPKNDTSSRKSAILATSIATLVGVSLLGFAPVAKAVQFWDTGLQNGILEGGSGTWDNAVTANWTNAADSLPHTTYAAGTNPAFFQRILPHNFPFLGNHQRNSVKKIFF